MRFCLMFVVCCYTQGIYIYRYIDTTIISYDIITFIERRPRHLPAFLSERQLLYLLLDTLLL